MLNLRYWKDVIEKLSKKKKGVNSRSIDILRCRYFNENNSIYEQWIMRVFFFGKTCMIASLSFWTFLRGQLSSVSVRSLQNGAHSISRTFSAFKAGTLSPWICNFHFFCSLPSNRHHSMMLYKPNYSIYCCVIYPVVDFFLTNIPHISVESLS